MEKCKDPHVLHTEVIAVYLLDLSSICEHIVFWWVIAGLIDGVHTLILFSHCTVATYAYLSTDRAHHLLSCVSPLTLPSIFILSLGQYSWNWKDCLLRLHTARLTINFHLVQGSKTVLVCSWLPTGNLTHMPPAVVLVLVPKDWDFFVFSVWDGRQQVSCF